MTIHPVTSDTDWDFFLEVHWRAHGLEDAFEPEIGAWVRSLGHEATSALLRKSYRVSAWVMKRDCIPILRWITWSKIDSPDTVTIDAFSGVKEELTPEAWKEFGNWLVSWAKSHSHKRIQSGTLLPWFETFVDFKIPSDVLTSSGSSEIFELGTDSPNILPFRTKIEKSRLLSKVEFKEMNWDLIPKHFQPFIPLIRPLLDSELCFSAVQEGKQVGFILGMRNFGKSGEPSSQILFRNKPSLLWQFQAKLISGWLAKKVKSGKILWLAEDKGSEEFGISVILLTEFIRRASESGIKSIRSPEISSDQLVLGLALKELGAKPIKKSPHFSRQF